MLLPKPGSGMIMTQIWSILRTIPSLIASVTVALAVVRHCSLDQNINSSVGLIWKSMPRIVTRCLLKSLKSESLLAQSTNLSMLILMILFLSLKENKRCYIMGDFNIDLLKCDQNSTVNTFVNLMYSYSFFPCIDRPTRICPGPNGTTISLTDNIFTNDFNNEIKSGNLVTDLSDHFPNFISIKGELHP